MDSLVAKYADGMVVILGRLVDPAPLIELVNGVRQIPLHQACALSHAPYHIFQNLPCFNHHKIIFYSYDQPIRVLNAQLDLLPAGSAFKV